MEQKAPLLGWIISREPLQIVLNVASCVFVEYFSFLKNLEVLQVLHPSRRSVKLTATHINYNTATRIISNTLILTYRSDMKCKKKLIDCGLSTLFSFSFILHKLCLIERNINQQI